MKSTASEPGLRACIVMMFKNNAVKSKKALKKQLATRVE